jgi:hypothetical protein
MIRRLVSRLGFWRRRPRPPLSPVRRFFRPQLEALEERAVPAAASPFFLDTSNQLWANTAAAGQPPSFINTGGFGLQVSVGEINTAGGGGQFAAVRDGNNQVWLYNGNTGVWVQTPAFAIDIAAGRGFVYLRDGNNQIYSVNIASRFAGLFGVSPATGKFAVQMSVGFSPASNPFSPFAGDFLAYRAPDNTVNFYRQLAGTGPGSFFANSGAFAIDLAAGNRGETFIRDGNDQVYILSISGPQLPSFPFITVNPSIQTQAFAEQMSVGQTSPTPGNELLAYRTGDNTVHFLRYAPTPVPPFLPAVTYYNLPGNPVANQVVAGTSQVSIRDTANMVTVYALNFNSDPTLPLPITTIQTGATGALLRVTTLTTNSSVVDQLALIDANQHLLVSQNTAGIPTTTVTFVDTGFLARDVQGFTGNP